LLEGNINPLQQGALLTSFVFVAPLRFNSTRQYFLRMIFYPVRKFLMQEDADV